MRLAYCPYMLHFKQPAGTSRGVLTEKPTYIIKIYDENDPEHFGLGECAVFPGLSPEADGRYEYKLVEMLANIALGRGTDLSRYSSLNYGLEMAIRDYAGGCRHIYWPTEFTEGKSEMTINGLIWMGSEEEMLARLDEKIKAGFKCVKMKIGSLDWKKELDIIRSIRSHFPADQLTIRVDANGGFVMDNVMPRLAQLADLEVHSIEQPIPARNIDLMKFICDVSPVPVALDEELIGVYDDEMKRHLLEYVQPAFIVCKPALCGGFSGAETWIGIAKELGIGWWITSALESNVGLNALAQFTAMMTQGTEWADFAQGLGTGSLYTNNFVTPIRLTGEHMTYDPSVPRDNAQVADLDWRY